MERLTIIMLLTLTSSAYAQAVTPSIMSTSKSSSVPSRLDPSGQLNTETAPALGPSTVQNPIAPTSTPNDARGPSSVQNGPQQRSEKQVGAPKASNTDSGFKAHYLPKRLGTLRYTVQVASPHIQIMMYTGLCPKSTLPEFRQMAIDRGLETRRRKVVRAAIANTESGRSQGCWYHDPNTGSVQLQLEGGFGEEFALEQIDRVRPGY